MTECEWIFYDNIHTDIIDKIIHISKVHTNYVLIGFSVKCHTQNTWEKTRAWERERKSDRNNVEQINLYLQIIKHHFVTTISLAPLHLATYFPFTSLQPAIKCWAVVVAIAVAAAADAVAVSPIIISHTSNGIIAFRFVFSLSWDVSQRWWRWWTNDENLGDNGILLYHVLKSWDLEISITWVLKWFSSFFHIIFFFFRFLLLIAAWSKNIKK